MNKILLGALGTALVGAIAAWPLGLCERCAIANGSAATIAVDPGTTASTTPEAPATAEAVASCQTNVDTVTKGKKINFETSGATISAASMAEIDAIAAAVKDCAGTTMEVAGHTDITGGDAANMSLSQARADSVVKALTEKGVPANRLVAKGYGETQPKVPGASTAANAENRRTEFKLQTAGAAAAAAPAN
jgi:outer membrane protein OmpA-like peptidoglycan-associated protein